MPPEARDTEDVWVVIAAYNEGRRLAATLSGLAGHGYRNVVVVDDGSRDDTAQVARSHGVWVLRHTINLGQGAALQTGLTFALRSGARYLVTFDGDGQHAAAEISQLLAPLRRGQADVALGSRFLGRAVDIPATRRLVLKGGVLFTRLVSGVKVTDAHNGFRAFTRDAATRVRITQNRMAHASELLDQIVEHRLRYVEVPVTIHYAADTTAKGQSSWNAVAIVVQYFLGRLVR
ncbi:MAG: glycosyltransferase family 2 protein [Zavarzinella sp.]|nr:glycosyltransferase family 2 protein [Zavarzinella sp.]